MYLWFLDGLQLYITFSLPNVPKISLILKWSELSVKFDNTTVFLEITIDSKLQLKADPFTMYTVSHILYMQL